MTVPAQLNSYHGEPYTSFYYEVIYNEVKSDKRTISILSMYSTNVTIIRNGN